MLRKSILPVGILALAASLCSISSAQAQAAWSVSQRWICRGEKLVTCDNSQKCETRDSRAMFEIDFAAMTVDNLNTPSDPGSQIAAKKYYPLTSYMNGNEFKGSSFFQTAAFQSFIVEEKPTADVLDGYYRARMITSYGGGDTIAHRS